MSKSAVTNVVVAGLGGQGVLKASDMMGEVAFRAGLDVKKSEIHGMSQRGGSVTSDVRFGPEVFSPMVPTGEADYLVVLDKTQVPPTQHLLREGGVLISPDVLLDAGQDLDDVSEDASTPLNRKNVNVALLGALSAYLEFPDALWMEALRANLPEKTWAANEAVFALGKAKVSR